MGRAECPVNRGGIVRVEGSTFDGLQRYPETRPRTGRAPRLTEEILFCSMGFTRVPGGSHPRSPTGSRVEGGPTRDSQGETGGTGP